MRGARSAAALALIAALAVIAWALVPRAEGDRWTDLEPAALADLLAREDPQLVNVHIPYEGELPGTDAFVPYDRVAELVDDLPADRDAPLVVYCRTGRMSQEALPVLVDLGYTRLYQLRGGFQAWQAAGLELRTDPARAG